MTAYVDAADVLAAMPLSTRPTSPPTGGSEDEAKIARITSLCASTAEMIDAEMTYDFHRHPADPYEPDETFILSGLGSRLLHAHRGFLDITSVEVRYSLTDTWSAIAEGDWEAFSMFEAEDPSRPLDHIQFLTRLPSGSRNVRITGVAGWAAPPARLVEMNVAWIRNHLSAGDSFSGAYQAPEGYLPPQRLVLPDDVRIFLTREMGRYRECYT